MNKDEPSKIIQKLSLKENLSSQEMSTFMDGLMLGQHSDLLIESFLIKLRLKGETVEEVVGAAQTMRKFSTKLPKNYEAVLDTCGTGGDGQQTLNISTLSALVACSAGARVAKHGNRSVSSVSGSADILEALNISLELSPESLCEMIEKAGFAFLFAPRFHSATKFAMPARKKIQGKTIFNLLGPLTNPANPDFQVIGVYDLSLVELMAKALLKLGIKKALVLHALSGTDEISVTSDTYVVEVSGLDLKKYTLEPKEFGIHYDSDEPLRCQTKEEAKNKAFSVLEGKSGVALDAVSLNAGASLYASGYASSIKAGYDLSKKLLQNKVVLLKLAELQRLSKRLAQ